VGGGGGGGWGWGVHQITVVTMYCVAASESDSVNLLAPKIAR